MHYLRRDKDDAIMKVIIAGTRYKDKENKIPFNDFKLVLEAVDRSGIERNGIQVTEIVSGKAIGVDQLGEQYANMRGIPIKEMPADWNTYGKRAGPIRNRQMAEYADIAIIIWDGESNGTRNMINEMIRKNKPYFIVMTESKDVPPE
jgi:hypothetical protein